MSSLLVPEGAGGFYRYQQLCTGPPQSSQTSLAAIEPAQLSRQGLLAIVRLFLYMSYISAFGFGVAMMLMAWLPEGTSSADGRANLISDGFQKHSVPASVVLVVCSFFIGIIRLLAVGWYVKDLGQGVAVAALLTVIISLVGTSAAACMHVVGHVCTLH